MKKQKPFSILLALCLLLQCTAITAAAETDAGAQTRSAEVTYPVAIDETNFPNENFRTYLSDKFDLDGDNALSQTEAEAVTEIKVNDSEICDFTGLAFFPNLVTLQCGWNQLTELDVSNNPALTDLYCPFNKLTALDVTQNPNLQNLYCHENQLTELDVTKNPALSVLCCYGNQLSTLDVTLNSALDTLDCKFNPLSTLNVRQNPALTGLDCAGNRLSSLDLTQNPTLTWLHCYQNSLTELDVSQNPELTVLYCYNNQLTELDVTQNPELTNLDCQKNRLTALDVSQNSNLESLNCSDNQLAELDVTQNPELTNLDCYNNQLTTLDVSQNTKLKNLDCSGNNIGKLELGDNSTLSYSEVAGQRRKVSAIRHTDESGSYYWTIDIGELVGEENLSRVTLSDDTVTNYGASYDAATGVATFTAFPNSVTYLYDTDQPDTQTLMDVTLAAEEAVAPNTLKIVSAKLNLDEDVDLLYTVKVDESYTDPYMVFTYHDTEYPVTDYTTLSDGRLCFVFSGVTPQCLGDNVSATLYAQACDGTTHSKTVANYSVRQYCVNMLKHYPDNETLVTLLSDLLVYGEKSQLYMNYRTDALVTDGVESLQPSTFTALTQTKKALSGEVSELVQWQSVGLRYENNTTMYFRFTAQQTEGLTVEITIDGRTSSYDVAALTPENGVYRVDFNGILATEFDKPVTAVFKRNGEQIGQTATYSVNSYIYSNQDSTDAALQALVQATYNYGASAQYYIAG
ncbi:MAG: leucine-rich repeat domain-containing protein [Faecousia sp.]